MEPALQLHLLDSHEHRIERAEDAVKEIAEQVAQHGERIDNLAARVDESRQEIGGKLDQLGAKLDAHDEHGRQINDRVRQLEGSAAKWSAVKKALLGLALGGAGVLIKELAMLLAHHFTR